MALARTKLTCDREQMLELLRIPALPGTLWAVARLHRTLFCPLHHRSRLRVPTVGDQARVMARTVPLCSRRVIYFGRVSPKGPCQLFFRHLELNPEESVSRVAGQECDGQPREEGGIEPSPVRTLYAVCRRPTRLALKANVLVRPPVCEAASEAVGVTGPGP